MTFTVRLDSEPLSPVTITIGTSDSTEGTVSPGTLLFDATNWFADKVVTVTGVDDQVHDGDITYTVLIGASVSADPLYNGINPADFTLVNIDNDPADTKFYVVNDSTIDRTYEYDPSGNPVENYAINSANTAPRGIASTAAGNRFWVVDANRNVYVYNASGVLQGSWSLGTLTSSALVEGIATNGTHIWVVDRTSRKVYYYANAASRIAGTQAATSSFALNASNTTPKDMVFGSQSGQTMLWVVDDGTAFDRVYRYILTAAGGSTTNTSWSISPENSSPTGIAVDPTNASMDIWIADSGKDRVYRYPNGRTTVIPLISDSFPLMAANANAQGIADPPPVVTTDSDSEQWNNSSMANTYDPVPTLSRRLELFSGKSPSVDATGIGARLQTSFRTDRLASLGTPKSTSAAKSDSQRTTVRLDLISSASTEDSNAPVIETMDALFTNLTKHGDLLN